MAENGVVLGLADEENSTELEQRKAEITGKLQKREDDRLADVQKRKEEKESVSAENESADFFHKRFTDGLNAIETTLSTSKDIEKGKLVEHFDGLLVSLQTLQKFLTDSVNCLTRRLASAKMVPISVLAMRLDISSVSISNSPILR